MDKRIYIKSIDRHKAKCLEWKASAYDVIHDRVMTKTPNYGTFSEHRSIEDQVQQCIQVMAELIEHLGVDASLFNSDYIKVGEQ